jgi:hypothetical protein
MTAKLLKTDGTATDIAPVNGTDFTLEECYAHIGCEIIEVIYHLPDDQVLIVDEDGFRNKNPQANYLATILARAAGLEGPIVGNAILCPASMLL